MPHDYTVEFICETRSGIYYRVSAGPKGGEPVSVKLDAYGALCLTCVRTDFHHCRECAHCRAADEADRDRRAAQTEQAA